MPGTIYRGLSASNRVATHIASQGVKETGEEGNHGEDIVRQVWPHLWCGKYHHDGAGYQGVGAGSQGDVRRP